MEWLSAFLSPNDVERAVEVMRKLSAHFRDGALTGGIAIEAQLAAQGRPLQRRALNDLDFVVGNFASIPDALADGFLVHHVHEDAPPGNLLLQLIDRERALRIDFFRAFGNTLLRAQTVDGPAGPLKVVAAEDLAARSTVQVCRALRANRSIDVKHAETFRRLSELGMPEGIREAWQDHRQALEATFQEAREEVERLLALYPELLVSEEYSRIVTPCDSCRDHAPFWRTDPPR